MESNDVSLRLRYYKDVREDINEVREKFELYSKKKLNDFLIKISENHIWIYIIGDKKQYFSPHLHIELETTNENETHVRCLFGPDPTLWTMFMFLHFVIAGIFILFGIFLYTDLSLGEPYLIDIALMSFMVFIWFILYFVAKQIRKKGENQMDEIKKLYNEIMN
jgi:hypothetical protein